jgi:predicted transcriptional regulator
MLVILSIKPKYADAILSKEKTVEFRKAGFPKNANAAIIYSSNHVGRIIGWFKIKTIVTLNPQDAWGKYKNLGSIPKNEFDEYYNGSKDAVCLEIGKVHKIDPPIDPYKNIKDFRPPQSFRYMLESDYDGLNDRIDFLKHLRLESFSSPAH